MTRVKFLDLKPDRGLYSQLDDAYERVMSSGQYIGGPEVEAFEREWANYCQTQYCVSCGSGQVALELLLKAYGIGPGDYVIVPSWTVTATWKAVLNTGANVRPIDGNRGKLNTGDVYFLPGTFNAIIAVHLYGYHVPVDDVVSVPVINDACQAHGIKNLDNAAFSFYPTKNLGAYGDGGAVVTNSWLVASFCREHRDSSRLDPLQAAFLRVKLGHLDSYNRVRAENAALYDELLADEIIKPPKGGMYHQYVIRADGRDALKASLAERGIETMIHYPLPPHRILGLDFDLPQADELACSVLSLPIMTSRENVIIVAQAVNELC